MYEALRRGMQLLAKHQRVTGVPEWVYDLNFEEAEKRCVIEGCGAHVQKLRDAEHELRQGTAWEDAAPCARDVKGAPNPMPFGAADEEDAVRRMLFASTRMALGSAVEAAIAKEAALVAPPSTRKTDVFVTSRLYNDAFLVAVWTSAHALYIFNLQSGIKEPPPPSVFTVPNAYSTLDLTDLFCRRTCPRQCPKDAQSLLHVLMRSTNPGSRGYAQGKRTNSVVLNLPNVIRLAGGTPCSRAHWRSRWHVAWWWATRSWWR